MYAHIEPIQSTQIQNTRIVLGIDYEDDLSAKYVILSFEGALWTDHVNEVLSKNWHEDSVSEASTYEDEAAIEVYLQKQRYVMAQGLEKHGSLNEFLNS